MRSDEENEGLETFLRDKLDSLSGKGLERILEVDPSMVFELLDESLDERGNARSNVVPDDKEITRSSVDQILRSELKEKRIGSVSKRPLWDVDADVVDGSPSKSVAFQLDAESGRMSSAEFELVGVSDAAGRSQIVPEQMVLIMVPLNWNRLHGGELKMLVRRGFTRLEMWVDPVIPEPQFSMVSVLGAQNIIRAILQELF